MAVHGDNEALPDAYQLEQFFRGGRSGSTSCTSEIQLQHLRGDGGRPLNTETRNDEVLNLPVHRESTISREVEGLQWFEGAQETATSTASLTPSCTSLVLVCALRGVPLWMPMTFTTPIFISQFCVLYIVSFASPQYLFASGAWLVPNSSSSSLNVMKTFATLLMLGQIAEEFHEISESMKVLRRSRLSYSSRAKVNCCWGAIGAQYILALMVMVASAHLILSRQNPIEPLWMTYYVFMTLNFDNMLVKFIMYVRTMQRSTTWKVSILEPDTPSSQKRTQRRDCAQSVVVLWIPLVLAASVTVFSRVFNVLPMTFLRYGYVSNHRPVVMFSSLSLPAGCCPAVASINSTASGFTGDDGVSVSVPCLARDAPEDLGPPPMVYWVAWSSHGSSPSSLQVREGVGSDGYKAVLSGRVAVHPLELMTWMQQRGYEAQQIQDVFEKLSQDQGGVAMYKQTFPYLANIHIFPFPWDKEVAIYAIAENPKTGALSPRPAVSNVLHSRQCPANCELCSHLGQCRKCKEGYRITDENTCEACTEDCLICEMDASQCSECKVGFGLLNYAQSDHQVHVCAACGSANCKNCDHNLLSTLEVPRRVPCNECEPGFGLVDHSICEKCMDSHCLECDGSANCTQCESGFALLQDPAGNKCDPCGPACLSCHSRDACVECQEAYVLKEGTCEACAPNCKNCTQSGPEACDMNGCYDGFGTKWKKFLGFPNRRECERCEAAECLVCEGKRNICQKCDKDFGVTAGGSCVRCGLGCVTCRGAGSCLECREGFVLQDEKCLVCSDRCFNCSTAGPGGCNRNGCAKGWTAILAQWKEDPYSFVCRPCADDCSTCDFKGPGECDV
mmetsp:Transcript_35615/g.77012  ORF Transcript_35615/g.77012 Transcript_35615/m.77012 type:complete len:845 (-) Transcript_35615:124-2658(-)